MSKFDEAKSILSALNVPAKQQNNMCCCVLLAMANVLEQTPWKKATIVLTWIFLHMRQRQTILMLIFLATGIVLFTEKEYTFQLLILIAHLTP